jgi:hypothetical protein
MNRQGVLQWEKTVGGNGYDGLSSVTETGKNHYLLGGYALSGISGDKTEPSRGRFDYWIVRLDYKNNNPVQTSSNPESISSIAQRDDNFIVYPNPAKDVLHVKTNGRAVFSFAEQTGKILLTKTIDGSGEIDISKFPPGTYHLKNNATGMTQKIVVVR